MIIDSLPAVEPIKCCLACGSEALQQIHSFGDTPVADRLLKGDEQGEPEAMIPLDLQLCKDCSLLQLGQSVDPAWMFDERYPYFSSVTQSLLKHSRTHVNEQLEAQSLSEQSLVVEIASNDGYLLQYFAEQGVPVLGIDPCPRQVELARDRGVASLCEFFGLDLAQQLVAEGQRADLIIANNVLAHVPQLNDFVAGMAWLLKEDGQIVVEVPYVVDLIEQLEFDTIYHQHLCYFSVTVLDSLFRRHDLYVNKLRQLSILGGSLRLYVSKYPSRDTSVSVLLALEQEQGVGELAYYHQFSKHLEQWKAIFLALLVQIKEEGKRIAAYGASAKGTMLLSYCGLDSADIEFVVDINEHKQGCYLPGSRIPIKAVPELCKVQPDYALMLVWNIADEVLAQQADYRARGGKFIMPFPVPKII